MKEQIEKKAIEEMARIIGAAIEFDELDFGMAEKTEIIAMKAAEKFYAEGYRKQSEGVWMTHHCTNGGKSKRGRTIIYKTYTCDACGKSNGKHETNYCPNCGAHMKGGAE